MSIEVQDRDTIVSRAMEIASATEREVYIARMCGDDASMRRQVEELVAARLKSRNAERAAADGATPAPRDSQHSNTHPAGGRAETLQTVSELQRVARRHRSVVAIGMDVLLLAATLLSIGAAAWAWHDRNQARKEAQVAVKERDQARKESAEIKQKFDEADTERQAALVARDKELTAERTAEHSVGVNKAVLAFVQSTVFSLGRPKDWKGGPKGWPGGMGQTVTLKEAVDTAEKQVAKAFVEKPLAEASIRALFGSFYLDLGEAAAAVTQYERALALRDKQLGSRHPDTIDCRNDLAKAYRQAGRPDEASRLYDNR